MSDRRGDFSNLKTFQIDQRDLHIIKFGELELNKKGKDGGKGISRNTLDPTSSLRWNSWTSV